MRTIPKPEDLIRIGTIRKAHGVRGEMNVELLVNLDDVELEWVWIEIDGIEVPFSVEGCRLSGDKMFLKIEGVHDDKEAGKLAGKALKVDDETISVEDLEADDLRYFVGYTLLTESGEEIGEITAVEDTTANELFYIEARDAYIPVAEDWIVEVRHEERQIVMNLPEGLLDL